MVQFLFVCQLTLMEKDSTSCKRILVKMEEQILKYVTKSTKVKQFVKKSGWHSTFENKQYTSGQMANGASYWENAR